MSQDRLQILKMVETGQITTAEAIKLLDALDEFPDTGAMESEVEEPPAPVQDLNPQGWWIYPTAAGAIIMAVGAPLVALGLTGQAAVFWAIFCGWIPFFVGLGILTLGVWSRSARWFHLRVKNTHSGRNSFALSLPLPLTLTAWIIRLARPLVPQLRDTAIDETILALRETSDIDRDNPLTIDVQDGDDGEQVLIYIG